MLYKECSQNSLLCLDALDPESNGLGLKIETNDGRTSETCLRIQGKFDVSNKEIVAPLDLVIQTFSGELRAREGEPPLIQKAALAGGYLYVLYAAANISERVHTSVDGILVPNQYTEHNLGVHLKIFLISRLLELVKEVLDVFRLKDPPQTPRESFRGGWALNAYAAGAILYYEVSRARSLLRNGPLSVVSRLGQGRNYSIDYLRTPRASTMPSYIGFHLLRESLEIVYEKDVVNTLTGNQPSKEDP